MLKIRYCLYEKSGNWYDGKHEPLITKELFDKTQEHLKRDQIVRSEIKEFAFTYIKDSGYPPTFEEMREGLKVSSNQSVIDFLAKLERQGIIKKNESAARGIKILPLGYEILGKPSLVAFLGATSAGAPIETIEISGGWQEIPGEVARLKQEVFLLKISGDSMINAGIDDGDVVLVQNRKEFVSGDIVCLFKVIHADIILICNRKERISPTDLMISHFRSRR